MVSYQSGVLWLTLGIICSAGVKEAASSPSSVSNPSVAPPQDLLALFQDYWHWKTHEFPEFATKIGINDESAGRLEHLNPEQFKQRKNKCEEFLQRAEAIDINSLSEDDLINLKIFKDELQTYIDNFKYLRYFTPVTFLGGPQLKFKQLVEKQTVLRHVDDYEKLLSRYGEFPRQAQELINLMKGNIESGLMPSNWSLIGVIKQLDDLLVPVEESVFYQPFLNIPAPVAREQKVALQKQAKVKIQEELLPSFKKMKDFLEEEYLPNLRLGTGVSTLEGGDDFYWACLKFHTSTDMTAQEIHNLGLSEVARIQKDVGETAADLGMGGKTLAEISEIVKSDPDQKFTSKEELLNTYRRAVFQTIYPLMDRLFTTIPNASVTIEGKDNPNAVYASYTSPSMDGSRPGTFYLNSYIYDQHKKYEVTALALHETVPGHHMHASYIRMKASTPEFRKYVDSSRKEAVPAKFPHHTAFLEGWGLYSEYLGEELGLYEDPYQRLGRHSFELLRASRLVVDTGLHALGWSRAKAIKYLLENTAMSEEAIKIEVNRYITWPGQACSYKIGEIKIKELRQKAETTLAEQFDVKVFHDVVLRCAGPLKILEDCVVNYISAAADPNGITQDDDTNRDENNNKSSDRNDHEDEEEEENLNDVSGGAPVMLRQSSIVNAMILISSVFSISWVCT